MTTRVCVFNQTRQSFLGLDVKVADTTPARLAGMLGSKKIEPDGGLWMIPSQGIHTFGMLFPVDLLYLDHEHRVIHMVEHLSPFRISPVRRRCASVLELPTKTIYTSQTQVGDELLICSPAEMEIHWKAQQARRLAEGPTAVEPPSAEVAWPSRRSVTLPADAPAKAKARGRGRLAGSNGAGAASPASASAAGPAVLDWKGAAGQDDGGFATAPPLPSLGRVTSSALVPLTMSANVDNKSASLAQRFLDWLQRLREGDSHNVIHVPLVAIYYNAGISRRSDIKDVTPSGAYVVTAEHWYPGTIVDMTLEYDPYYLQAASAREDAVRSIRMRAKIVGEGPDGVQVRFVFLNKEERLRFRQFLTGGKVRGAA